MHVVKSLSVAVIVAALCAGNASAQSLRNADEPAEFPPAGYTATQYVDSKGCVYVRAGYGDAVKWVPRVSRSRQVLCGFKPSVTSAQAALPVIPDAPSAGAATAPMATVATTTTTPSRVATATKPVTYAVAAPVQAKTTVPVNTTPKAPTLADAKVVGKTCGTNASGFPVRCTPQSVHPADYILKELPAGITVRTAGGGSMTTTKPTLVRVPIKTTPSTQTYAAVTSPVGASAPSATSTSPQRPVSVSGCPNLSSNAAAYMVSSFPVRCGPQAVHPSDYVKKQNAQTVRQNTAVAQVIQAAQSQGIPVVAPVARATPTGYKQAFDDGRLNPQRGPQTAVGDVQMAQVWSNTVPAYQVGTKKTTFLEQLFGVKPAAAVASPVAVTRLSTKSVAPTVTYQAPQTSSAFKYVQVGTFGVPENAQRSISRLAALGLPVSSQQLNRNGKTLKIVLAGPFATQQQAMQALGQVRAAGYSDAFARK